MFLNLVFSKKIFLEIASLYLTILTFSQLWVLHSRNFDFVSQNGEVETRSSDFFLQLRITSHNFNFNFSELWERNLQFWFSSQLWIYISQFWLCFSELWDIKLTVVGYKVQFWGNKILFFLRFASLYLTVLTFFFFFFFAIGVYTSQFWT